MGIDVQEVVEVLVRLESEGEPAFEQAYGEDALSAAREIEGTLMALMEYNVGHVVLWEQFLRTPDEVASALESVVASLLQRDQALGDWLTRSLDRCRTVTKGNDG
jgi:hypothetical protein